MAKNNNIVKKQTYNVKDIMTIMDCSQSTAYNIIIALNKELRAKGMLTMGGKVSIDYFERRYIKYDD